MSVVRRHDPRFTTVPLVLDSPHSGTAYPEDFDHLPSRSIVRQAEDTYVGELYAAAPDLGATLVEALFPRAYIDPNRHVADIDLQLMADAWPGPSTPSRKTAAGHRAGLAAGAWRRADVRAQALRSGSAAAHRQLLRTLSSKC